MESETLFSELAANAKRFSALVDDVSSEQGLWKPTPESWSILEVLCHMLDEEKEDFRVFLDFTLHRPGEPRPKIKPEAWVSERKYNEKNLAESLREFQAARESSLTWLRGLSSPDWEAQYEAPWGTIRAGDILASWVAHDLLHTRQVLKLHWAYTLVQSNPYGVEYAGNW
jgi:uncharacterized damage-inducible protein DinB